MSTASCRAAARPLDGARWVACRPGFFLPVRVLSRLFRRLFLPDLKNAFEGGRLCFSGHLAGLADASAFNAPPTGASPSPRNRNAVDHAFPIAQKPRGFVQSGFDEVAAHSPRMSATVSRDLTEASRFFLYLSHFQNCSGVRDFR